MTRCVIAAAALLIALLTAGEAAAADPANHLPLVPPNALALLALDLDGDNTERREAAWAFLNTDLPFATTQRWLRRARIDRRVTDVLLVADGIGHSAALIRWSDVHDLERQTFEAMLRAAGLEPQDSRRLPGGARLWTQPDPPADATDASTRPPAVLVLSPELLVAGDRGVVLQIAAGLGGRGRRAPIVEALGPTPPRTFAWFVALDPGAEPEQPTTTFVQLGMDEGALVEVRFECRTDEEAAAFKRRARAWLDDPARADELAWLKLQQGTLGRAVVAQHRERVHVVLTLSAEQAATTLAAGLDVLNKKAE